MTTFCVAAGKDHQEDCVEAAVLGMQAVGHEADQGKGGKGPGEGGQLVDPVCCCRFCSWCVCCSCWAADRWAAYVR